MFAYFECINKICVCPYRERITFFAKLSFIIIWGISFRSRKKTCIQSRKFQKSFSMILQTHNLILIYQRRMIYLPTLDLHTIRIRNNHPVPTKRSRFPREIFIISAINWTYMLCYNLKNSFKFIILCLQIIIFKMYKWILRISQLKYELS